MKTNKWFFSVVEEAILNKNFIKKHPNYSAGRIEIYHKDHQYDVSEIRLLLPEEMFIKVRDALDFKECDYFQIADVHSEELEKNIKKHDLSNKRKI